MVRHVVRQVVKYGHWNDYIAAQRALNAAGVAVGLPPYRVFGSHWGTMNEVFVEAEYADAAAIDRVMGAAMNDPTALAAFREMTTHLVDGSAHDYLLAEETLD